MVLAILRGRESFTILSIYESLTFVHPIVKGWGSTSDSQYPVMPNNLQVFLMLMRIWKMVRVLMTENEVDGI